MFGPKLIKAASQPLMKFYWIYTKSVTLSRALGEKATFLTFSGFYKFHVEEVSKKSGVGVLEVPFSESQSLLWSLWTKAA